MADAGDDHDDPLERTTEPQPPGPLPRDPPPPPGYVDPLQESELLDQPFAPEQ